MLRLQGLIAVPFPTVAVVWTLLRWLAALPTTLRGVFPFPFPPSPTSGAGQTHRSRATPAGTLFSLVTYWRARQGTSSSAPRDPSPTAAVDHAAAASRTPDTNALFRVVSPASCPNPRLRAAYFTWSPRSFRLGAFPRFGLREFLLQPSSPPGSSPPPPAQAQEPPIPRPRPEAPARARAGPGADLPARPALAVRRGRLPGEGRGAASPCPPPCFPPKRSSLGAPLPQKAFAPGHLNFHFRLRTKRRCTWTFPGALCVFKASGGV